MQAITPAALPADALLARYAGGNGYSDCFTTALVRSVTLGEFIEAFYTSRLFKLERAVLATLFACPSTDAEAAGLATGRRNRFAAWTVEARARDQILLCDLRGRTRSWLKVESSAAPGTRLFFGSAIVPAHPARSGRAALGTGFRALLVIHRLYSRALLRAAARRLEHAA